MNLEDGFYYLMEASTTMQYTMMNAESGTANLMVVGMEYLEDSYQQQNRKLAAVYSTQHSKHNSHETQIVTSVDINIDGYVQFSPNVISILNPGVPSGVTGTDLGYDLQEDGVAAQAVNQAAEAVQNPEQSAIQTGQTSTQQLATNMQSFVQFQGAILQVLGYGANLIATTL